MMKTPLPSIRFETGICLHRLVLVTEEGAEQKPRIDWHIIGRLEDGTPFLLIYRGHQTKWRCNVTLGDRLRNKILIQFGKQVRNAPTPPDYLIVHDISVTDSDDILDGMAAADEIEIPFVRDVWRAQYLNDRDDDYVALFVSYAEKDEVKALGAKWDGKAKVWRVKKHEDMRAFSRWMPTTPAHSQTSEMVA